MSDSGKKIVKARTSSHSDVSTTPASKAFQIAQTERQFGEAVVHLLRESTEPVSLSNFQEEWISTEDGLAYELRAELNAPAE